jgi:hypothetical protein
MLQAKDWILPRALELVYTAWDLEPFARGCGYDGSTPPSSIFTRSIATTSTTSWRPSR